MDRDRKHSVENETYARCDESEEVVVFWSCFVILRDWVG